MGGEDRESNFEKRYRVFLEHKKTHPGAIYSEFTMKRVVQVLRKGVPHDTLGPRINGCDDWWEAGAGNYLTILSHIPVTERTRVVDYGCGSLRIGAHFIDNLAPGNYFGIDVNPDLIAMGKDLAGTELITEKKPDFGGIDEASIARAESFGADLVFSYAVCIHVHPDEAPLYFRNLERLAAEPGATVLFTAAVAANPTRQHALCWPLERYIASLPGLKFEGFPGARRTMTSFGEPYESGYLMFRRE